METDYLIQRRTKKNRRGRSYSDFYTFDEEAFKKEDQGLLIKGEWNTSYLALAAAGVLGAISWILVVYSWQDYYNQMVNFTFTQNLTVLRDVIVAGDVLVNNDSTILGDIITDEIIESSNATGDQGPTGGMGLQGFQGERVRYLYFYK